jgi:hypothetical protein
MHHNAHEGRFDIFNQVPEMNSKHVKYQSPAFHKWADHSLDEYIRNPSDIRDENANHQIYNPSYALVHKDLSVGLPDFNRYISKDQRAEKLPFGRSPHPYEGTHEGFHATRPFTGNILPFKMQLGRDNLYERMHGLPKYTKEQMNQMKRYYSK